MAGIYFHIPFCKQACHYCNFFFTTSVRNVRETCVAMENELELRQDYLQEEVINTIYFGGGTPSMLAPTEIQFLVEKVKSLFLCNEKMEVTLEANPDNLSRSYLSALKSTDVNRFSLGIQSFYQDELEWMNRAHNAEEAENCIDLCLEYGYESFSVDLIFGIPGSDSDRWKNNLLKLIEKRPDHISCYALTVEEGTALAHHIKVGKSPTPLDSDMEEQFYMAHDLLEAAGYHHYEISNYALDGKKSKHNSAYWEGTKYLGIGPSAHSYDGASRSWNIAHLPKYLTAIKEGREFTTKEVLSKTDQFNEWIMTGLRRSAGLDLKLLETRFVGFKEHFDEALTEIPESYYKMERNTMVLSREGLVFADFVGSGLFKVDEES